MKQHTAQQRDPVRRIGFYGRLQAFRFNEKKLDTLKTITEHKQSLGARVRLSDTVRAAVDEYIARYLKQHPEALEANPK